MLKAIIFDCFGVIYKDTYKEFLNHHAVKLSQYLKNNDILGKELGFPRYYYELARNIDMQLINDDQFYYTLSQASGEPVENIKTQMRQVEGMLNEDMIDLIAHLKENYKLALIANADKNFLNNFLQFKNIKDYFDIIITSSELMVTKPDLQFFEKISNHFNLKFDELLFIDDSELNIEAVRGYGIQAIKFLNQKQLREAFGMVNANKPTFSI